MAVEAAAVEANVTGLAQTKVDLFLEKREHCLLIIARFLPTSNSRASFWLPVVVGFTSRINSFG